MNTKKIIGVGILGAIALAILQSCKTIPTWAMIAGKNFKYLWLLSRDKTMPQHIKDEYLQKAGQLGYDTSKRYG